MKIPPNPAYPPAVAELEQEWLEARRTAISETSSSRECVGIGLSGGGIRSATICLGVFQGLARHELLRYVDYISSVSGGGYFASFLGRLYGRREKGRPSPNAVTVEKLLAEKPDSRPVRNVRDFGRYIAPKGSGDIINAAAGILRNWFTIHIVLGVLFLAVFIFCILCSQLYAQYVPRAFLGLCGLIPALITLIVVIPCGWAYWIPPKARPGIKGPAWVLLGFIAALGISLIVKWPVSLLGSQHMYLGSGLLVLVGMTIVFHGFGRIRIPPPATFDVLQATYRNRLSRWLGKSLSALAVVLIVAGLNYAGARIFHAVFAQHSSWRLAGLGAAVTAAFALVQRVKLAFDKLSVDVSRKTVKKLALVVAALGIWAVILAGWSALAHFLAGRMLRDSALPYHLWIFFAILCVLAWVMGLHRGFVNFSSQHSLYSARLTRAYLGASNPNRDQTCHPLTESDPDDDISMAAYWGWNHGMKKRPCARGAPIHLLNVTINETVDGRSSIQQLDRKGTSLAIGPCALSVGIRHHAIPVSKPKEANNPRPPERFKCATPVKNNDYNVFKSTSKKPSFDIERLTLGHWTAISGAAFSTGTGSHTNLFLSLLTGFANVRLGYWWKPNIMPHQAQSFLEVQRMLFNEFTARFHGTARRAWYLSDGGHFENLGAYELLRRRLKRIMLIDAEADPDYSYEGLLLLIRKARIDFGAVIRFLTAEELDQKLDPACRPLFGTLEDLRRPEGRQAVSKAHAAFAVVEYPDDVDCPDKLEDRHKHNAVGDLLYLKSTLTGDEPPDVRDYHAQNPDFPHQTTADQFFDEAQWESHRALGLHIGEQLFQPWPRSSAGWHPADLFSIRNEAAR